MFWIYTALGCGMGILALFLSGKCEHEADKEGAQSDGEREPLLGENGRAASPPLSPVVKKRAKWWDAFSQISKPTRWTLFKLCSVFFLDSLGSGMVPFSLINFYLERKFDLKKGKLGGIMSATWYVL
jgi:para-aminobenzoate synthetase